MQIWLRFQGNAHVDHENYSSRQTGLDRLYDNFSAPLPRSLK